MIQILGLTYCYRKRKEALNNCSLEIKPGKIYGLLGKNGAGKTTLLKNMAGMLFPQQGQVKTMEYHAFERKPGMLSKIYYLAEEFYLPAISIYSYMRVYGSFYPSFEDKLFVSLIGDFELNLKEDLNQLSYGQRKKVLIAFAIATRCPLVIMDEPTNGLDIPSKSVFRKLIADNITHGRSFIISTHQVKDVENMIDPVMILEKGKIIFEHSLEEISTKLYFGLSDHIDSTTLYHIPEFHRNAVVKARTTEAESKVELELLFSAVVKYPEKVNSLF